jgi:hypothetical protein
MKLTLIKPNIGRMEHSLYVDEGRMEPLQLGVLAALTPPEVEVVLHDDRMETIRMMSRPIWWPSRSRPIPPGVLMKSAPNFAGEVFRLSWAVCNPP